VAAEESAAPAGRLARIFGRIRLDPEHTIVLVTGLTVAVLGMTDVIETPKPLIAATLAVLSILAFSQLRQAKRREEAEARASAHGEVLERLVGRIRDLEGEYTNSLTMRHLPEGPAIGKALERMTVEASSYHFRGGTGTYLRSATLPRLYRRSGTTAGSRRTVEIEIIDPGSAATCERYARYRRALDSQRAGATPSEWTARRVRLESSGTVLAAVWFSQHTSLSPRVFVTERISSLRFDMSDSEAIVTNEDRELPALLVSRRNTFYFALRAELELSQEQARELPLAAAPALPSATEEITAEQVRDTLTAMGFAADGMESEWTEVVALAFNRPNPYGH